MLIFFVSVHNHGVCTRLAVIRLAADPVPSLQLKTFAELATLKVGDLRK
jgi:hypothetical protein